MSRLMISCQRAGELTEKKYDVGLSVADTFRLRLHFSMCSVCKMYERQSEMLAGLLKRLAKSQRIYRSAEEREALKAKIQKRIQEEV
jgi:predicted anti-sigma-YlaC factor YlaD